VPCRRYPNSKLRHAGAQTAALYHLSERQRQNLKQCLCTILGSCRCRRGTSCGAGDDECLQLRQGLWPRSGFAPTREEFSAIKCVKLARCNRYVPNFGFVIYKDRYSSTFTLGAGSFIYPLHIGRNKLHSDNGPASWSSGQSF
jgi:hypothetical protein